MTDRKWRGEGEFWGVERILKMGLLSVQNKGGAGLHKHVCK